MNIRDVKYSDFQADFKGELRVMKKNQPKEFDDLINFVMGGGCQSAAFEHDGKVLGIMQWVEYSPHCLYVAIFPTKAINKHKIIAARFVKKFFYHLAECYQCERMETTSLDTDFLNKWHRFIGFKFEGKKRKYMLGLDYNMWGVVFDGC